MSTRPGSLFFYAPWPLGYHNVEPERKAAGFADAGYQVVYAAGVGVRNPRLSTVGKAAGQLARGLRPRRRSAASGARGQLASLSVLVVPPRQLAAVRRVNGAWVERQLRRAVRSWPDAVAWVRWPTPEVVDALHALRPAAIVYECVDAYDAYPDWAPPWRAIHEAAEAELLARADAVVVPSPPLAERFGPRHPNVHLVPHGVDLFPWRARPNDVRRVLGFVGTLDYRLDTAVVGEVARRHPEWQVRLMGPVQRGFRAGEVALPNVRVEPPVPHARIGGVLADLDLGLMAYVDEPTHRAACPVKALEFLAAGRPAVATPNRALQEYRGLMYFATSPDEFVRQAERALIEDTPERARQRRAAAAARTWDRRIGELVAIVGSLDGRR